MEPNEPLVVDCDTCKQQHTSACDDCLVTFICDRAPDQAVIISLDEMRALRLLSGAGLVPTVRHRSRPA